MDYDEAYKIFEQLGGEKNWANKAYDFDEKDRKPKKILQLPPQEYAELCSAIRTKYANKIPKDGGILYKNHYYRYNYNEQQEKIVCVFKVTIEGNEDKIKSMEEFYARFKRG